MTNRIINRKIFRPKTGQHANSGFSLVELMVAMVLGLVLLGGVASVFLATNKSSQINKALEQVQSNARFAYELFAGNVRQAALIGCTAQSGRVANVLNGSPNDPDNPTKWWANWDANAVHGFDDNEVAKAVAFGTGVGSRVKGTDALTLMGGTGGGVSVVSYDPASFEFTTKQELADLQNGNIIVACDYIQATIMYVTVDGADDKIIKHKMGTTIPGNCSNGLGYPTDCSAGGGSGYTYSTNSKIFKMTAHNWYIGNNPVGGESLYRVTGNAGKASEMVRGVTNMQLMYHLKEKSQFITASAVATNDWDKVDAVQVVFTLESSKNVGTDSKPVKRQFTTTIAIRNRLN